MADKQVNIIYRLKDEATSGIKRLFGSLTSLTGILGAAGLAGAIWKTTQAFGIQEQAINSLNTALKNQGNFTEATTKSLQAYASELQRATTFGDEAIIQAQALFAQFGLEEQQIKDLTKATLDLSAAKGMDLRSAADLVAKSVGSSTNALSRYGVTIEGAINSTERVNMAVSELGRVFGGQAEAQADTFLGTIQQLKNAFGDVMEVVGSKLAPAIQDMAKSLTTFATENQPIISESLDILFKGFSTVGGAIFGIGKFLGETTFKITEFLEKTNEFFETVQKFNPFMIMYNSLGNLKDRMTEFLGFNKDHNDELLKQNQQFLEVKNEQEQEKRIEKNEQEIVDLIEHEEKKLEIKQDVIDKEKDMIDDLEKATIKAMQDEIRAREHKNKETAALLMNASAMEENFAKASGNAIKQFIGKEIDAYTQTAIVNALASVPFPANIAAAALMAGLGAAAKQTVMALSFAEGGIVGGVQGATLGRDNRVANVRDGEMFLNAEQQAGLFNFVNDMVALPNSDDNGGDSGSSSGNFILKMEDGTSLAKGIYYKQKEMQRTGEL